jgi:ketosteroid isomerase-like protein
MSLVTGELASRFIETLGVLERQGADALPQMVELFSPMARMTNTAIKRRGGELTGEVGARQFWREYRSSFAEVHTEFYEVTRDQRSAGLFWTSRGKDPHGNPFEYDGATLLVFEDDGLIIQLRSYYDSRELELRAPVHVAAGAAPRPA